MVALLPAGAEIGTMHVAPATDYSFERIYLSEAFDLSSYFAISSAVMTNKPKFL